MDKQEIGRAIKRERLRSGLTLLGLASRAGCTEANIRLIERGQAPSLPLADAILRTLRVRLVIGRVEGRKSLDLGRVE